MSARRAPDGQPSPSEEPIYRQSFRIRPTNNAAAFQGGGVEELD